MTKLERFVNFLSIICWLAYIVGLSLHRTLPIGYKACTVFNFIECAS